MAVADEAAGAPEIETEVTPAMIAAGVEALRDEWPAQAAHSIEFSVGYAEGALADLALAVIRRALAVRDRENGPTASPRL